MPRPTVAAIIPALNEEQTVASVVAVLRASPLIDEVLVVSDGSSDRTAERARDAGATVYDLPSTRGKGEAMLHGLAHTDAQVLFFCDADLMGLSADHVERVLLPVLSGARAMNVGLHDRGILNAITPHLPLIGGERALVRGVIEPIPPQYLHGFMAETALNYSCRSRKLPYGVVVLPGLGFRRKYDKVGWKRAIAQYIRMSVQVAGAMLEVRIAKRFKRF